ncbi:2-C-methyl-D-erythritol 4-phosphate cytidylyltransferase [Corynebacterium fournieri]|uniref:2-C-methyl-D-erythritol 4-phosphate cytidylyltransferase n=1 Tax=Corynebacterium fournieri TaxID=1852390 RepID=UPI000A2F3495|nr:2-C-methyl-D-erythritol 4-phosphate cytidylyltransferase [Corynebacterium fournieri]WJY98276.1 2-C-methyl-D-erythritol 4-phosphate cytidylyltransferase [Corynebacterium fournieri]
MRRETVAVVAAAGQGTRLGAAVPKAYVELGGRTLLERSVATMASVVDRVVVVVSPEMEAEARGILSGYAVQFVHGGAERADSIYAALNAVPLDDACILVHDAARALTPPEMVSRVVDAVLGGAAAVVPVVPVADTVKRVAGDAVEETLDRSVLRAAQTPQGFDLRQLREANEKYLAEDPSFVATDDASLMEWFGAPVTTVEGDPMAFKITTPLDLRLAESLVGTL